MHTIPAYEPKVILLSRAGEKRVFKNRQEAIRVLGRDFIRQQVNEDFIVYAGTRRVFVEGEFVEEPHYLESDYVLRDEFGGKLTGEHFIDFDAHFQQIRLRLVFGRNWNKLQFWNGEGPVPGTGHSGGRYKNRLRSPKTMQARRDAAGVVLEDGEPPIRPRRNQHHLPSSWDDTHRHIERSWKRHRKHQWKG